MTPWILARRAQRLNPSILREILKVTERPGVLSLAGGLPSPDSFPVARLREACERVLSAQGREALQYAPSEGHAPLRQWVAEHLRRKGLAVRADQVLITNGSQQGLDLAAKVLVEAGAPVAVERPSYLGALQAFSPFEPSFAGLDGDGEGPLPGAIAALPRTAPGCRLAYLLPNFQNPTGRLMTAARRQAVVQAAQAAGVPLLEDDPYGDLWFDAEPPDALASLWPQGVLYLGSFSKILAPGLRLGYAVAPPALYPKLLQAKQAADLHTCGLAQRLVHEVVSGGFLDDHVAAIRARYRRQRDAMAQALARSMPAGATWEVPQGGMFFWVRLGGGCDTLALLARAVEAGVAYVPGAAFYADAADGATLRLSFVTQAPEDIARGVAILGQVIGARADPAQPL